MSFAQCCPPEDAGASASLVPVAESEHVTFPFLDMLPELRLMVYEYVLNFSSVDDYFRDYFQNKCANDNYQAPVVQKSCPSILLVSKEITREALPMLHHAPLHLSYGIMGSHLHNLISSSLLRKLHHVKISDAGCRHMGTPPSTVFTGYCYAAVELCTILRQGHSLQSFTLEFSSGYVHHHLTHCLVNPDRAHCGINSWTHNLLRYLKELRGIDRVQLHLSIPTGVRDDLIDIMESPAEGFLALPYHIRHKIYEYAIDYNDGTNAMRRATKALAFNTDPPAPVKKTPTILLINKQITGEAANILFSKPLVIEKLYPVVNNAMVNLNDFITLHIFKRVTHLEVRITDFRHLNILVDIAGQLKNRRSRLQHLHLHFDEPRQQRLMIEKGEYYPDYSVWQSLRPLNSLVGTVKELKVTGSLPDCFTEPLIWNVTKRTEVEFKRRLMVRNEHMHELDARHLRMRPFAKNIRLG